MPETTIRPAHTLKEGSKIRFMDQELTIVAVESIDTWTRLTFDTLYWNPHTEEWKLAYECHYGFCFQTIE